MPIAKNITPKRSGPSALAWFEVHFPHELAAADVVKALQPLAYRPLGNPLEPGNFLRDFKKICQANGLRVISVHAIRHTVATLLKSQRVPDRDIQLILGHSRIITTQEVYQHDDDESRRTALQGLAVALLDSPDTKAPQNERSGVLANSLDSSSSCQNGCQAPTFAERLKVIISGGAYRIRTDGLFHAMEAR